MKTKKTACIIFVVLGIAATVTGIVFAALFISDIPEMLKNGTLLAYVWEIIASPVLILFGLFSSLISAHVYLVSSGKQRQNGVYPAAPLQASVPETFEPVYRSEFSADAPDSDISPFDDSEQSDTSPHDDSEDSGFKMAEDFEQYKSDGSSDESDN